jgi:hypothetical protein
MRNTAPMLLVFAIAVSGTMLAMSGFGAVWGAEPPQTQAAQEQLANNASEANPNNGPISGPVSSGDSDIVGLIANGLGSVTDWVGAVVLLPVTLKKLGFPWWFAAPLGSLAYIITGFGIIEFATNREF